MRVFLISLYLYFNAYVMNAQTRKIDFEVYFKDNYIGSVTAFDIKKGTASVKDVKTNTNTKILVTSIHVESELNLLYENGILKKGIAYRTASRGSEDIHATTIKNGEKSYKIVSNGVSNDLKNTDIKFCVADLYFTEPKSEKKVFSNMYGKHLDIVSNETGKYKIVLPDGNTAVYEYFNGQISKIEVEMSLGKIITKRKS